MRKTAPKNCAVTLKLSPETWAELHRQSGNAWMSKTRYAHRALCAFLAHTRALEKKRKLTDAFDEVFSGGTREVA